MGDALATAVSRAVAALAARSDEVDLLNVFPVADGDTGVNMLRTARAIAEAADATTGLPRGERADALARAALVGAQGNSGMILSQLVRGAADALADADEIDAAAIARALRAASRAADAAVRRPVEGTVLTVARAMAGAAEDALRAGRDAVLDAAVATGASAVAATTAQMALLSEAGVVDAGALGLLVLVEGLADALAGRPPRVPAAAAPAPVPAVHPPSRYRYCTSFLVEGAGIDLGALEDALLAQGDSLLVMGGAQRAKVHLHTDSPEDAATRAGAWGRVSDLEAQDMRRQEAERAARLRRAAEPAEAPLVAVAEGEGVAELLRGLGAAPAAPAVPVVGEVVIAIAPAPALPDAHVVEVQGLPALLAAALAWEPGGDAGASVRRMREAAAAVRCIDVPRATADDLAAALRPALADGDARLITILVGADAGVDAAEVEAWARAIAGPGVEVEAHDGGQPTPALAVGVE